MLFDAILEYCNRRVSRKILDANCDIVAENRMLAGEIHPSGLGGARITAHSAGGGPFIFEDVFESR